MHCNTQELKTPFVHLKNFVNVKASDICEPFWIRKICIDRKSGVIKTVVIASERLPQIRRWWYEYTRWIMLYAGMTWLITKKDGKLLNARERKRIKKFHKGCNKSLRIGENRELKELHQNQDYDWRILKECRRSPGESNFVLESLEE